MKLMRSLVYIMILGCSMGIATSSHTRALAWEYGERSELIGKQAPRFTHSDQYGKRIDLEELSGQVILINFWATWCGPCVRELPSLQALHKSYQDRGLVVLGVAGFSEGVSEIRDLISRAGISYSTLTLSEEKLQDTVARFGDFEGLPHSILIDRSGVIREVWSGARSGTEFEASVQAYLGGSSSKSNLSAYRTAR